MRPITYFALLCLTTIGLALAPTTSNAQQYGPCNAVATVPACAAPCPAPCAPPCAAPCVPPCAPTCAQTCAPASCPTCDNWHAPTLQESAVSFSELIGFPCGPDQPGQQPASCGPTWTFTADAIVMQRISLNGVPLALRQTDGATLLNSQNIQFNDAAGPRFIIARQLNSCCDLQFEYFSIDGSHGFFSAGDANGVQLSNIAPLVQGSAGTNLNFYDHARLYNFELNLRRKTEDGPTFLVGLRWLELQESLDVNLVTPLVNLPEWNSDANNHLFGGQLGAEWAVWPKGGRFGLDGLVKAGAYACHAAQVNSSPLYSPTAEAEIDRAAFVGEIGLTAHFQITDHVLLRGGYQLMWIDGIALAPSQIPLTNLSTGTTGINADGGVLYHGGFGGLEVDY